MKLAWLVYEWDDPDEAPNRKETPTLHITEPPTYLGKIVPIVYQELENPDVL